LGRFLACTHYFLNPFPDNIIKQKLANRNLRIGRTMVKDNMTNDFPMSEDKPTNATDSTGICSSACLAEKLKKLMDTPSATDSALMDYELEDLKK